MRILSFLALTLLLAMPIVASELVVDIPFDQSSVVLDEAGPYTRINVPSVSYITQEGAPCLPVMKARVALPTACRAIDMEVLEAEYTTLPGKHLVMPAMAPVPFSVEQEIHPVAPDPHIYERDVTVPDRVIEFENSSVFMGIPIATYTVYPVRWNAADGQIRVLSNLRIKVSYEYDESVMTVRRRSADSEQRAQSIVRNMVANPEGVSASGAAIVDKRDLAYGEYVIITDDSYESYAQEIADWKTMKGVPCNVYTETWVDNNYNTLDLQQDIRGFLLEAIEEGAEFALIYGDDDRIAGRDVIISAGGYTEYPPVDLYWVDINDTAPGADQWDSNGNGVWGESSDNIDWNPDIWTGRASVNSSSDAGEFVDKVMAYEAVQGTDYFETAPIEMRVGYSTGILWTSPYCPGSAGAENISDYVPNSSWEEEKCYEDWGNNSSTITINMIDDGPHHVYHASHGSQQSMYTSYGDSYTRNDIMNQTNITDGGLPAIWNSIACLIGHLDSYECCGDAWNNSIGGAGFGMFNARYGWGTPSNPGQGPSEVVCREFYEEHWVSNTIQLGPAHSTSMNNLCPPSDSYMDWCIKEYNLLGDPEISMYTEDAPRLTASHPSYVGGATNVTITVSDSKAPVQDALVCLQKGDWQSGEVYETGYTDSSGEVTLYVNPQSAGTMTVVATKHNYLPYEGTIDCDVGVVEEGERVYTNGVGNVFPSPALSTATVPFTLAQPGHVTVEIFDLSGRKVATLADGNMAQGDHSLIWNVAEGADAVPAGLYKVRVSTDAFTGVASVMVIR